MSGTGKKGNRWNFQGLKLRKCNILRWIKWSLPTSPGHLHFNRHQEPNGWESHKVPPIQNWVVAFELEVQRNLGFTFEYNPKLSSFFTATFGVFPSKSQSARLELSVCRGKCPFLYQVFIVQFRHSFPRMFTYSNGRHLATSSEGTSLMMSKCSSEALR